METEDSRPGNVERSAHSSRVVLHQGVATTVGIEKRRLKTSRSINVEFRNYHGPQNIAIAAAIALNVATTKHKD